VKGIFITFEGPDGSGKTTQLRRVAQTLMKRGIPCTTTREPGGTPISDAIRSILLNPENRNMNAWTELLLYTASRAQLVAEVIRPALERGDVVLCDRYIDATIAYQGKGLGIDPETVRHLSEIATGKLWPDRTYLIDVPARLGLQRIRSARRGAYNGRLDRIESRQIMYHERVREAFLEIARRESRCLVIDGTGPEDVVYERIWDDLRHLLEGRGFRP
jgi:dTMP kinase